MSLRLRWAATCRSDRALRLFFISLLGLRFVFPFFRNPLDRIYLDMFRHWEDSASLVWVNFAGSLDPKLYQVWLCAVRALTHDSRFGIAFSSGLLCAGMAFCWWRACGEIFPRRQALKLGCVIALCPSLLLIYQYFMIETLMLLMVALSVWLTFRAIRLQTFAAGFAAVFCLMLTLFARANAIPVALMLLVYLCVHYARRRAVLLAVLPFFMLFTAAATVHSYAGLYFPAPFYFGGLTKTDYYSSAQMEHFMLPNGGEVAVSAPAMHDNSLWPFFTLYWQSRATEAYFTIVPAEGAKTWDNAIRQASASWTFYDELYYRSANFLLFLAGPSWPDAMHDASDRLVTLNGLLRWMWPVLIGITCIYGPGTHAPPREALLLLIALAMCALMAVQANVIFDGRFRKPVEPFLLLGACVVWQRHGRPGGAEDCTPLQLARMLAARSFTMLYHGVRPRT